MDGQEHYRKAEELAEEARNLLGRGDIQVTAAAAWAAVAQVHATLALAAATEAASATGPSSMPSVRMRPGSTQHRQAEQPGT